MVVFDLLGHQEKVKKFLGEAVYKGLLQMEVQEEKKEELIHQLRTTILSGDRERSDGANPTSGRG
eukprot:7896812-Karenia_brevis.AAC.1